jgi:carboxypeptidase family protein
MKGKLSKLPLVVWVLGITVLLSSPLRAQVAGAIVSGAVTDAQGGAVANAKVSARNVQTSVVTETTSNVDGAYSILNLIPSDYEISATAPGFSTSVAKVTLTVGAKQEMNFSLNANTGGGAMEAIFANGEPNPQFGQTTATQIPNRQIQLALKLIW